MGNGEWGIGNRIVSSIKLGARSAQRRALEKQGNGNRMAESFDMTSF
ncbi:MAG: hypothetical protein F6K47_18420 [Symploca sp. SIO2E6]|nr:hypothetical protein [Symploca sp. SIO2E6]